MAQQWGDNRHADRQIESSRAASRRDMAIEANGWKNNLADTFKEMGLAAQKNAYLERRTAQKQGYEKGVMEETRAYNELQADEKELANMPKAEAALKESEARTAKLNAEAERAGRTAPTKEGKTSNIFEGTGGQPLTSADVDAAYKVASKDLGAEAKAEVERLLMEKEEELAAVPDVRPDSDWFGANEDYAGNIDKRAEIESKYAELLAKYGIKDRLSKLGVFIKTSAKPQAPVQNNKETIKERMDRLNSGG